MSEIKQFKYGRNVTIKVEARDFDLDNITRSMQEAEVATLNRVARDGRVEAIRQITQVFNVRPRALGAKITLSRATHSRRFSKITAKGRRISLIDFGAKRPTIKSGDKGVSAEVMRGRRFVIPGTFIAKPTRGKNIGIPGVYIRQHYLDDPRQRYPIQKQFGPQVSEMLSTQGVGEKVEAFIREKLPQIFDSTFRFFTTKRTSSSVR